MLSLGNTHQKPGEGDRKKKMFHGLRTVTSISFVFPMNHFCTYSVPMIGGCPSTGTSLNFTVFLVSFSIVNLTVFSMFGLPVDC